jgi:multicomponent Na+:H+ antiporter subunit E
MSVDETRRTPVSALVARAVVLVVIWVALWGQPSAGNVLSGVLVAGVVTWMFPGGPGRLPAEHEGAIRPIAALHFGVFFAWALVVATWDVATTVLGPRSKVAEAVVAVPLRSRSPVIATIVANAITLTPGTMTIEVDDPSERGSDDHIVLYVHVLGLGDAQSIRDDGLDFERLAVKAFGSRADRRRWAEAEAAAAAVGATPAADPATTEEP